MYRLIIIIVRAKIIEYSNNIPNKLQPLSLCVSFRNFKLVHDRYSYANKYGRKETSVRISLFLETKSMLACNHSILQSTFFVQYYNIDK